MQVGSMWIASVAGELERIGRTRPPIGCWQQVLNSLVHGGRRRGDSDALRTAAAGGGWASIYEPVDRVRVNAAQSASHSSSAITVALNEQSTAKAASVGKPFSASRRLCRASRQLTSSRFGFSISSKAALRSAHCAKSSRCRPSTHRRSHWRRPRTCCARAAACARSRFSYCKE